jgi:hypothetical protein
MFARMTNEPSTPEPPTRKGYDAGNRRHVERRARTSKVRRGRLDDAFKWLMDDPRGRLLMWDRLGEAGIFHSSMSSSAELTAFREGRRDIGLIDLARIMRLCPAQYARMTEEAQARQTSTLDGDKDDGRDDQRAF